jgi:hypothetical protein
MNAAERTGSSFEGIGRLSLAEKPVEISICDRLLDWMAFPFGHDSGLYYNGRRTFTPQYCGLCSILSIIIFITLFFILVWPCLTGSIIFSDLKIQSFHVHAEKTIPNFLAQLYGR